MKTFLTSIIFFLSFSLPALAISCGRHEEFKKVLFEKYHETPRYNAVNVRSRVFFQFFISPQRTFTILATFPDGRTCMLVSGEGLKELSLRPPSDSQRSNQIYIPKEKGKDL